MLQLQKIEILARTVNVIIGPKTKGREQAGRKRMRKLTQQYI